MKKAIIAAAALGAVLTGCSGSDDQEAAPAPDGPSAPPVEGYPVLTPGDSADYETATDDGGTTVYRVTLESVKGDDTLFDDPVTVVTLEVANTGQGRASMDLGGEYAVAPNGDRLDDIAVAMDDSLTDPAPGQHKTVQLAYDLPKSWTGVIVWPAYDGTTEHDAFGVEISSP